jgi:hypothetical protein
MRHSRISVPVMEDGRTGERGRPVGRAPASALLLRPRSSEPSQPKRAGRVSRRTLIWPFGSADPGRSRCTPAPAASTSSSSEILAFLTAVIGDTSVPRWGAPAAASSSASDATSQGPSSSRSEQHCPRRRACPGQRDEQAPSADSEVVPVVVDLWWRRGGPCPSTRLRPASVIPRVPRWTPGSRPYDLRRPGSSSPARAARRPCRRPPSLLHSPPLQASQDGDRDQACDS